MRRAMLKFDGIKWFMTRWRWITQLVLPLPFSCSNRGSISVWLLKVGHNVSVWRMSTFMGYNTRVLSLFLFLRDSWLAEFNFLKNPYDLWQNKNEICWAKYNTLFHPLRMSTFVTTLCRQLISDIRARWWSDQTCLEKGRVISRFRYPHRHKLKVSTEPMSARNRARNRMTADRCD